MQAEAKCIREQHVYGEPMCTTLSRTELASLPHFCLTNMWLHGLNLHSLFHLFKKHGALPFVREGMQHWVALNRGIYKGYASGMSNKMFDSTGWQKREGPCLTRKQQKPRKSPLPTSSPLQPSMAKRTLLIQCITVILKRCPPHKNK